MFNLTRILSLLVALIAVSGCGDGVSVGSDNSFDVAGAPSAATATQTASVIVVDGTGSGTVTLTGNVTRHPVTAIVPRGRVFVRWNDGREWLEDPDAASTYFLLPEVDGASYRIQAIFDAGPDLNTLTDDAATSRFLTLASFGGSNNDIRQWSGKDAALWLQEQLSKPAISILEDTVAGISTTGSANTSIPDYLSYRFHRTLYEGDEQLRTRMAFALSQLFAVGGDVVAAGTLPRQGAGWHDLLQEHAFGNYRDLLQSVTYSPAMGEWLTYITNNAYNANLGTQPDESYARELLQLFTIGLYELNLDGSQKLDESGSPIPTYDHDDVANLARVFTGMTHAVQPSYVNTTINAVKYGDLPMQIFADAHSTREKAFLDTVIPAGTTGADSINLALDALFSHPNVAPFVARQLIQRFTASNPTARYINLVSTAFEDGRFISASGIEFGDGRRGSLPATLAAILLDASLFGDPDTDNVEFGKVREPLLGIAHWMRAFNVQNLEWLTVDQYLNNPDAVGSLQMAYMASPSVFNFYRPGYVPPNTQAGEMGMTVPEFQLADTTSFSGFVNAIAPLVMEQPSVSDCSPDGGGYYFPGLQPCNEALDKQPYAPDYSVELSLANDAEQLVEHLNIVLLGGRLEEDIRADIIDAVNVYELNSELNDEQMADALAARVHIAVLMIVTTPAYHVIY